MRVLVFGGSFNPVHWGHLILAEEVGEEFGYDRVLFVPALRSPFKEGRDDPGPSHRLAMLRLACADNPRFFVDDRELRRPEPSWTIDTIRSLREEPDIENPPGLLVGDDLLAGFADWHESECLEREAKIIVARRSGIEGPQRFLRASNRLVALSSSEIRERLAAGKSTRYLLPDPVFGYIREKGLYGLG